MIKYRIFNIFVSFVFINLIFTPSLLYSDEPILPVTIESFDFSGVDKSISTLFVERFAGILINICPFKVLERDKLNAIYNEKSIRLTGATTDTLNDELILSAHYIISGKIIKSDNIYVVMVKLISSKSSEIVVTADARCISCTPEQFLKKASFDLAENLQLFTDMWLFDKNENNHCKKLLIMEDIKTNKP